MSAASTSPTDRRDSALIDEALVEEALALIDSATIVADASALILARSENPGGTELQAVRVLETIASRLGARSERIDVAPDRHNLSIRFGPDPSAAAPGFLMLGHSDVVPAGTGWSADAFTPRVADGWLTGRGSTDMKGGLAASLQALAAVHRVLPEMPLELLVTADEEDLATGIRRQLAEPALPYRACIVAEPTDLATVIACRGAANLQLDITGKAAHAGRPEDGVSAIVAAARVIDAIDRDHARLRAGSCGMLGSATWSVGRIEGGHGTSIVPDRCTLLVDRRLMPGERADAVRDELQRRLDELDLGEARVESRVLMEMPGFETPPGHPLVHAAVSALAAEGRESPVEAWTAACEGGFVGEHHGCPTIILGPGDITAQAHQPDERVAIADLETAARAYARLAIALADQDLPLTDPAPHTTRTDGP